MSITAMSDESLRAETAYRTAQLQRAARPWAWQVRRARASRVAARQALGQGSRRRTLLPGSGAWLAAR